jgi:ribosomal protein L3
MTNSSNAVNSFFNQERLRQAAALAGPNADPVTVIHTKGMACIIFNKLEKDKAVGVAEVWLRGKYFGTYKGYPNAIWKQSSQPTAPSVADSIAGIAKRIGKKERRRDAVDYARKNLPTEVFELLGLSTD